jgi:IAA-amino acid hydrolase
MAGLLGAAKVLHGQRDSLKGSVKLIFQPAEEGYGGAKVMIAEGVLEEVRTVQNSARSISHIIIVAF